MGSQIITLTTDWGDEDFFAGKIKSRLLSYIQNVQIVDITHKIPKFDVNYGAFIVKNACLDFPTNTIHIIDINSTENLKKVDNPVQFIVVKYANQFYICTDNRLPSLVFNNKNFSAVKIHESYYQGCSFCTFAAHDIFCKVARDLCLGVDFTEIGEPITQLQPIAERRFYIENETLNLTAIYTDSYGNAYLNITFNEFEELRKGRNIFITIGEFKHTPIKLSQSYFDVNSPDDQSSPMLTISSSGHLQLAMKNSSIEKLLGIKVYGTIIKIDFK